MSTSARPLSATEQLEASKSLYVKTAHIREPRQSCLHQSNWPNTSTSTSNSPNSKSSPPPVPPKPRPLGQSQRRSIINVPLSPPLATICSDTTRLLSSSLSSPHSTEPRNDFSPNRIEEKQIQKSAENPTNCDQFFDNMGLDATVLHSLTVLATCEPTNLKAESTLSSNTTNFNEHTASKCGSSIGNAIDEPTGSEFKSLTVVERNAKVIKWIYGQI